MKTQSQSAEQQVCNGLGMQLQSQCVRARMHKHAVGYK